MYVCICKYVCVFYITLIANFKYLVFSVRKNWRLPHQEKHLVGLTAVVCESSFLAPRLCAVHHNMARFVYYTY